MHLIYSPLRKVELSYEEKDSCLKTNFSLMATAMPGANESLRHLSHMIYCIFIFFETVWIGFLTLPTEKRHCFCNEVYAVLRTSNSAISIKIIRFMRKTRIEGRASKTYTTTTLCQQQK
jgi:hypothetical protein